MRARLEEPLLDDIERHVLKQLGEAPKGHGVFGAGGGKYWHRAADKLVKKGFADCFYDAYFITDAGRSLLRSNVSS